MQSLIRLRSDDFHLEEGKKGPILCTGIKGMSLIMFWSPNCEISRFLEPKFRHLPQVISGCKFCLLNINENQSVINMSKQTIAPIEFVPYICFAVNGRPFLQYDDEASLEKLISFVQYSMKLVETKKSFIDKGAKVESEIPPYLISKAYLDFKCDDSGFCFLTFNDAYKKPLQNGGQGAPTQLHASGQNYFQRS